MVNNRPKIPLPITGWGIFIVSITPKWIPFYRVNIRTSLGHNFYNNVKNCIVGSFMSIQTSFEYVLHFAK